jgi:hypothetical protein
LSPDAIPGPPLFNRLSGILKSSGQRAIECALVNRILVDEVDRFQMRPLVIITPARIYLDVVRTYSGRNCVVRPNVELNDRKLSQKELVYAHRYVAQEGWSEYANGMWKPDPELTRFMEESLDA